jgi:hypothetical protein
VASPHESDFELFAAACSNTSFPKPGRYHRSCEIPHVRKVFMGEGFFPLPKKTLDRIWKQTT